MCFWIKLSRYSCFMWEELEDSIDSSNLCQDYPPNSKGQCDSHTQLSSLHDEGATFYMSLFPWKLKWFLFTFFIDFTSFTVFFLPPTFLYRVLNVSPNIDKDKPSATVFLLTHFSPVPHFYTPWKRQKTFGFLKFSGGIEMWHWTKMG